MSAADIARLLALATVWSLSFVFQRVLVPVLGPVWVPMLRALIAGIALVGWFSVVGLDARVREHWRAYLFVGVLNCALPFVFYGIAAIHLPASYLVITNALVPLLAAPVAAIWLGERLTVAKIVGLVAGAGGVVLVSGAGPIAPDAAFFWSIAACLGAVLCYALSGVWFKKHGSHLDPIAAAGWSQLFAGLALIPVLPIAPIRGEISTVIIANTLALALLCSALAYLLYFRLIANVGPTRAMTVTFLMPALGMLWGVLFLDEIVTLPMIAGAALIIAGTAVVLRRPPQVRSPTHAARRPRPT